MAQHSLLAQIIFEQYTVAGPESPSVDSVSRAG